MASGQRRFATRARCCNAIRRRLGRGRGLSPHNWAGHAQLAHALTHSKDRLEEAEAAAERAVELAPHEAGAHMSAGAVARAAGRREGAAEAFRRALAIDPQSSAAHNELARLNLRRGRFANTSPDALVRAATGFATAVRADPRATSSRHNLDLVLRHFLRLTAYLIFVVALFAGRLSAHSTTSVARALPVLALLLPGAFAIRFIARLPASLRPHLRRLLLSGRTSVAAGLELVATAALVASCFLAQPSRATILGVAVTGALLGRVVLWSQRPQKR